MPEAKVGGGLLIREHIWHVGPEGPVECGESIFRDDRYRVCVACVWVRPARSFGA